MSKIISSDKNYKIWLKELKDKVQSSQIKASIRINTELLLLYWDLGKRIIEKQQSTNWGEALIPQLSKDLTNAFPGSKGFSRSNLFYIKKWVEFYSQSPIVQQVVGQLQQIENQSFVKESQFVQQLVAQLPWGHNVVIIDKCKTIEEAIFYVKATIQNNWSRAVLMVQIETGLYKRKGNILNNFKTTLSAPQADLARETLKNPYNFDFLTIGREAKERDLEIALIDQIQKFLLELGQGFAFMGKQYPIHVGDSDFFLDLLFYHTKLRCYVIVELKVTDFQPEFAGKLNFYLNVVDDQLKHASDQPSIGILLCKTPNRVVVEYSLKNINNPLGIAEYQLTEIIPENLKGELPTIEELEKELQAVK